jgi:MFS family permease
LISVASAIIAPLVAAVTPRIPMKSLLLSAFPFFSLSLALIPFSQSLWTLLIPVIFFGVAMGLAIPTVQTLLVRLAPTENRAAIMSFQGFVLRLGQTLGPLIMTVVLVFWDVPGIYWFGSILALALIPPIYFTIVRAPEIKSPN